MASLAEQACYTLISNPHEGDFPNEQDLKNMLGMFATMHIIHNVWMLQNEIPFLLLCLSTNIIHHSLMNIYWKFTHVHQLVIVYNDRSQFSLNIK